MNQTMFLTLALTPTFALFPILALTPILALAPAFALALTPGMLSRACLRRAS